MTTPKWIFRFWISTTTMDSTTLERWALSNVLYQALFYTYFQRFTTAILIAFLNSKTTQANEFTESQNIAAIDLEGALSNLNFQDIDVGETEAPARLPDWACCYCGIHNADSVVKCLTTGKWFCNGKSTGTASCIVTHLVKAKCKEVRFVITIFRNL